MPRRFFTRVSSRYRQNETPWYLLPFQAVSQHPMYFAANRRSIAGALWVGAFVALLPVPGQTGIALLAALLLRVNLPVASVAVWMTNPLTMGPIFYYEYQLGALILNYPLQQFQIELSWDWLTGSLMEIWKPLLLGSFVSATVIASLIYVLINAAWRWSTSYRYRRRHVKAERVQ
jgi:uncharacterized protein (DUF2062 family)